MSCKAELMKAGKVVSIYPFQVIKPEDFADRARDAYEHFRKNSGVSLLDDDVTVVFGKAD